MKQISQFYVQCYKVKFLIILYQRYKNLSILIILGQRTTEENSHQTQQVKDSEDEAKVPGMNIISHEHHIKGTTYSLHQMNKMNIISDEQPDHYINKQHFIK